MGGRAGGRRRAVRLRRMAPGVAGRRPGRRGARGRLRSRPGIPGRAAGGGGRAPAPAAHGGATRRRTTRWRRRRSPPAGHHPWSSGCSPSSPAPCSPGPWVPASRRAAALVGALVQRRAPVTGSTWLGGALLLPAAAAYVVRPWGDTDGWAGSWAGRTTSCWRPAPRPLGALAADSSRRQRSETHRRAAPPPGRAPRPRARLRHERQRPDLQAVAPEDGVVGHPHRSRCRIGRWMQKTPYEMCPRCRSGRPRHHSRVAGRPVREDAR